MLCLGLLLLLVGLFTRLALLCFVELTHVFRERAVPLGAVGRHAVQVVRRPVVIIPLAPGVVHLGGVYLSLLYFVYRTGVSRSSFIIFFRM